MYTPLSTEVVTKDLPYVFVYGTLKRGRGNNRLLSTSTYIGETSTKEKFALGNVGFPYAFPESIVPDKYSKLLFPVRGEVWKIEDHSSADSLDHLEGYPVHYDRTIIETQDYGKAWMYTQMDWSAAEKCMACTLTERKEWSWP